MDKKEFIVVPKLLGLIVDPHSGEVAGLIDASGLLTQESQEALADSLGEVVASLQIDSEREKLERLYLLSACDVESERPRPDQA